MLRCWLWGWAVLFALLVTAGIDPAPLVPAFFWPGCPCCHSECTGCATGIGSRWYEFTISGITDNSCTECNELYNGTFEVVFGGACTWRTVNLLGGCFPFGTSPRYILGFGLITAPSTYGVALRAFDRNGGVLARWEKITGTVDPDDLADCLDAHELTLVSSLTTCSNWPTTVTVSPSIS